VFMGAAKPSPNFQAQKGRLTRGALIAGGLALWVFTLGEPLMGWGSFRLFVSIQDRLFGQQVELGHWKRSRVSWSFGVVQGFSKPIYLRS